MNQLANRYSSPQMRNIWSDESRFMTWRKLWIALAEGQMNMTLADDSGKQRITPEQIAQLRSKIDSFKEDPSEMERLSKLEEECRHDVVAHVRLLGELCPLAKPIIHLGATSCDITDNADLVLLRESLFLIRHRLVGVIDSLSNIATIYADTPCVAYTHYQTAQLTTVGKRVCLWLADFVNDYNEICSRVDSLHFRGLKGATGTQASYLQLFNGDKSKVWALEKFVANKMGFNKVYPITGQTYSRKIDSQILSTLSGIGQSANKFGTDMRLLQHDHEIYEPSESTQVGSSAMPYKSNPMRAERTCSLARYLVNECHNAEMTAMNQWLERTLDDSAVRRISLPNAFLAADATLKLVLNVANGLVVNQDVIRRRVAKELPFVLTEPIMMKAVKNGGDRQKLHEELRKESRKAQKSLLMYDENPLLTNLAQHDEFKITVRTMGHNDMQAKKFIGMCEHQVVDFLDRFVDPIRKEHPEALDQKSEIKV
jgi:adenylosuccinate lyase